MRWTTGIKRVKYSIYAAKETMRYGGINNINISNVKYGKLMENKRILVTGAGSGIGLAIARKCLECGAAVVITGRNEDKLKRAVDQLADAGVEYLVWDVSDAGLSEKMLNLSKDLLKGPIDILVNNAGVQPKEFFPNVSVGEWERIYDTNSRGLFFLTQSLCKQWINEGKGNSYRKIINISSHGGFVGATYPYRLSKWDVRGLTEGLGLKMAEYGIIVNGIAPGAIRTEMQTLSMEQGENTYCNQNPLKRVALPEEVAELAIFMMSDACNFMVGQTILLDGGGGLR